MAFQKGDKNINKLDTLPEKFTKEFVDYVCHLYANNTSVLEMSEILSTPQNTIKKYLSTGVVWFNKLNVHDLSAIRKQRASIAKSLHTAEYDFLKNQKSNEKIFLSADDKRFYVYLHRDINGVVFYVGKGTGDRKDSKSGRTTAWKNIANKGFTVEVYKNNLSEIDATLLEDSLIANPLDGWELVNKQRSDTKIDYSKYDWDDVFIYDETSPSCLRWKHGNGQQNQSKRGVCGVAGYINSSGNYKRYKVSYKGTEYLAHRIIYQMFRKDICSDLVINHIDADPLNNKISNLEMVTTAENNRKTHRDVFGELSSTNTSGIQNIRKTYQDNGGWSAQVYYKDVCGITKGKKFYFSAYGEELAMALAEDYVVTMKKLITEERTRLEQLKESMYAFC